MHKPQGYVLLIMILLVALIIVLLAFSQGGAWDNLIGTQDKPAPVQVNVDKTQNQVDEYNKNLNKEINQ